MNSLKVWEGSLANRAEGTRIHYFHHFDSFIKWTGISADELRKMKYKEDQEAKPWERNRVENLLREYLKTLEEKNQSCNTQNLALASIRSFFAAQGMPLFLKKEDKPQGCAFGSKALTREEIKQVKNAAENLRDKALIMFLKDSGLRQSDAGKLKWKDFKDYGDGFWGFQIQTQKKGIKARGFIGSEATELLKLYKRKRMEGTKKLPPEENIEDNPVFALLSDPTKAVRPVSMSGSLGTIISLAEIERATPHGFRKFWEQNMHVEHVAYQKQMNGRALDSVERSYYWKEIEDLFEMYRSNYHNLRIEKQDFKEAEERIRRDYEREIDSLRKRLEERDRQFIERDREINDVKRQINEVNKKLETYDNYKGIFKDDKEMELFANSLLVSYELDRRRESGQSLEEAWADLKKEGIITDDLEWERGQELANHVTPIIGRMLLFDLARRRKAAKKQEGEE